MKNTGALEQGDFEKIFGLGPDLLCVISSNGEVARFNANFKMMFGDFKPSYTGHPLLSFVHPDDLAATKNELENLPPGYRTSRFENRCRSQTGEYRLLSWLIHRDPDSDLFYCVARDLTNERLNQANLNQVFLALNQSAIVSFTDPLGNITEVNDNFCKISAYSRDELIGKNHRILNSGHHPKSFFRELWTTISSGKTWVGDMENRNRFGGTYWFHTVITPLFATDGQISHYIAVRFDITTQKRAELESQYLREKIEIALTQSIKSEQYFRAIFEHAPLGLLQVDSQLRFVAANQQFLQLVGYSESELMRLNLLDLTPEEDHSMVKSRVAAGLEQVGVVRRFERRYLHKSKKIVPAMLTTKSVQFEENGEVFLFSVIEDLTEALKKEEALRTARARQVTTENYLRVIMDSIQQGVWGLDKQGRFTFMNQSGLRLLGYRDLNELRGQKAHALVHHSHPDGRPYPQAECPMYDSFRSGASHQVRNECLWKKDGAAIPINYFSAPIFVDGEVVGSVVSFEDLTEQKKLEREVEVQRQKAIHNAKLASLGEMSAGVAHEINNPLTVIAAATNLIHRFKNEPDKIDAKVETIKRATERISKIVLGLRKFSRTTDGSIHKLCRLDEIVREALILTEARAGRGAVALQLDVANDCAIVCDDVEIEQVLVNLINNAIDALKSIQDKWIKIRVFKDASAVVLQIRDSGPGISREVEEKLFQPFFTTKPVGEGTGLGLSITKGILDQHKAVISLRREEPGTCFEIRFRHPEENKNVA